MWSALFWKRRALCLTVLALSLFGVVALPTVSDSRDYMLHTCPGGDYHQFETSSFDGWLECRRACMADPQCRAMTVTWGGLQAENAVCRLKNRACNLMANPLGNTFVRDEYAFAVHGRGRPGGDFHHFDLWSGDVFSSYMACRDACQSDSRCLAFSYIEPGYPGGGVCWLKDVVNDPVQGQGRYSGLIYERVVTGGGSLPEDPPPPPEEEASPLAEWMENVNLPGMDFHALAVSTDDPELCQLFCRETDGCAAWTYARPGVVDEYGWCYLKHSVPEPVADFNTISGVIP